MENNSLNTRAAATLMQKLRACAGRCDVAQLSQDIQQQEQYWDKVVAERCGGAGASLAVCASTLNGLQESLSFISSALGMAKTPQERALLLATYNEQVRDINTATAQFEKLGASASVIDVFMTQTAQILPDLALSVGGNGRPALAVKQADSVRSSPLPVADRTVASNGLAYQSNPKHTLGAAGNRPNAGIEPKNSLYLFENSIPGRRNDRYALDANGQVHRFYSDHGGVYHWSGSTGQGANSLSGRDVPNEIEDVFNLPKKGW